VRRFLVALASLDLAAHDRVVSRFASASASTAFARADAVLGETIERSGRADARDALAGPLMQLVRERTSDAEDVVEVEGDQIGVDDASPEAGGGAPVTLDAHAAALDPIAEPALAALLGLLVYDVIPEKTFRVLYEPFAEDIPVTSILS